MVNAGRELLVPVDHHDSLCISSGLGQTVRRSLDVGEGRLGLTQTRADGLRRVLEGLARALEMLAGLGQLGGKQVTFGFDPTQLGAEIAKEASTLFHRRLAFGQQFLEFTLHLGSVFAEAHQLHLQITPLGRDGRQLLLEIEPRLFGDLELSNEVFAFVLRLGQVLAQHRHLGGNTFGVAEAALGLVQAAMMVGQVRFDRLDASLGGVEIGLLLLGLLACSLEIALGGLEHRLGRGEIDVGGVEGRHGRCQFGLRRLQLRGRRRELVSSGFELGCRARQFALGVVHQCAEFDCF